MTELSAGTVASKWRTVEKIAVWSLSILLMLLFFVAGLPKVTMQPGWAHRFAAWGYSMPFLVAIGAIEIIGAILLLVPRVAAYSAALLAAVMVGAAYTHITFGERGQLARPVIFLVLLLIVCWRRWSKLEDQRRE